MPDGFSPEDTIQGSILRFASELTTWILVPWAVWSNWGALAGTFSLLVVLSLPAVFNTPGDKNTTGIPVSGNIRITIEMFLFAMMTLAGYLLWGIVGLVPLAVLSFGTMWSNRKRYAWLAPQTAALDQDEQE